MMKDVTQDIPGVIDIYNKNHYVIDTNKISAGTFVTCPFDGSMKVGRNENGEVCLVKKSLFRPFKKC